MNSYNGAILMVVFVVTKFAFFGTLGAAISNDDIREAQIQFKWAFCAVVKAEGGKQLIPIKADTVLHTGDKLKMLLEFRKMCFVYVIYHSPQGDLRLLFPYELHHIEIDRKINVQYYIPRGDEWYELDDHLGCEKVYLLASAHRLKALETLIKRFDAAEAEQKGALLTQVLAEIYRLRDQQRELKSTAERPFSMVGRVRAGEQPEQFFIPDLAGFAIGISATDLYCRTYRIEHR